MAGMKRGEKARQFWKGIVDLYVGSGQLQTAFAAEHKVGLHMFRYWIYKLRREGAGAQATPEMRLVPVRVETPAQPRVGAAGEERLDIRVAGLSIRVRTGTDPRYVASVVAALRAAGC